MRTRWHCSAPALIAGAVTPSEPQWSFPRSIPLPMEREMPQDRSRASLQLLYNISRELAISLDLRTVLGRVLFLCIDNVGAERGTLIVLNDQHMPEEAAIVYNHELL